MKLGLAQSGGEVWNSNFGFALCLGLIYTLSAYVIAGTWQAGFADSGAATVDALSAPQAAGRWLQALVLSPFAVFIHLALLAGCVRIAWEGPGKPGGRLLSGLLHGLAHGAVIFGLYWLSCLGWVQAGLNGSGSGSALAACLGVGLLGVPAGGLLFGSYLALMCAVFGQLPNNAFGALAVADFKGFLRCRLTESGLELLMIGLDRVPKRADFGPTLPEGWRLIDRFHIAK